MVLFFFFFWFWVSFRVGVLHRRQGQLTSIMALHQCVLFSWYKEGGWVWDLLGAVMGQPVWDSGFFSRLIIMTFTCVVDIVYTHTKTLVLSHLVTRPMADFESTIMPEEGLMNPSHQLISLLFY